MKSILLFGLILGFYLSSAFAQQELPQEKLKAVFPSAANFKASKKTVTDAKRADIENILGQKLADADLHPQFYIAMKAEGGLVGVVYLGTADGAKIEFGVGITAEGGNVSAVKVFAPADSSLAAEAFLKQFKGRTVSMVKPPAPEQQALVDFLRAQDDNMLTMDEPEQALIRKLKAAQTPIADEPAALEKGMGEYAKLLATADPAKTDADLLPKLRELLKKSPDAAQTFSAEVKAAGCDWTQLNKAYKTLNDSCEICHADYQFTFKKKRAELVPPRTASQFVVGQEITAPAGQEAAAQALATEVKKAVALVKSLYGLK